MSKKQTATGQQRHFLFVYDSNSTRRKSNTEVENTEKKSERISDLNEERTKRIRRKLIDELKEFGC